MGAHDGANKSTDDAEGWERDHAEIASIIVQELHVRDELIALLNDMEAVPLEGPGAQGFREDMKERAHELRPMIEGRMAYLSAMPPIASLVPEIDLDSPDAEAYVRHLALMVEGASACFAALDAQVQVFAAMRRRGVNV